MAATSKSILTASKNSPIQNSMSKFNPTLAVPHLDWPISAKSHLRKEGCSEGKGFAGSPILGFLEGIGRLTSPKLNRSRIPVWQASWRGSSGGHHRPTRQLRNWLSLRPIVRISGEIRWARFSGRSRSGRNRLRIPGVVSTSPVSQSNSAELQAVGLESVVQPRL